MRCVCVCVDHDERKDLEANEAEKQTTKEMHLK